jgi:hypothetical protein
VARYGLGLHGLHHGIGGGARMRITAANRAAISVFGLCSGAMGMTVLYTAVNGGVPMPPESHGGAIYAIPAEAWAVAVVFQGFLLMLANARGWLGVLFSTAIFGAFMNGFLAYFAAEAAFGFIVSRGALVFALLHGSIAIAAGLDAASDRLSDFRGRIQ